MTHAPAVVVIAIGAILRFAVGGVDLEVIGVMLMGTGAVALVVPVARSVPARRTAAVHPDRRLPRPPATIAPRR